jgi:ubiquinone/menaquinone biosynthesis C-methylase UbiE
MPTSAHHRSGDRGTSTIGAEALDSRHLDNVLARRTLADITLANRLFGGNAAAEYGLARLLGRGTRPEHLLVLDVGAGAGDVLGSLRRSVCRRGISLTGVALDFHPEAARMARERRELAVQADAFRLPFLDDAVDVVVASQLLHHFARSAAVSLIAEMDRVARVGVVIADLRRSRAAAWGIWIAAHALRFHPISRADGVVSVRRGFTADEIRSLCLEAGFRATVRRRPGARVVAYWSKMHAHP